jgi:hypothetical protein
MPQATAPILTAANEPTPTLTPSSLAPRENMHDCWTAHPRDPRSFDQAVTIIRDAHRMDGARRDITTTDLSSYAFGTRDGTSMDIAPIPYAGRDRGTTLALREQAFDQLGARGGFPGYYLRSLPVKLTLAAVNYHLSRDTKPALLRIAGGEVRAIFSERYAPLDDELVLEIVDDALRAAGMRSDVIARAISTGPSTVLRLTVPSESLAVKRGDVIEAGVDLANSEIGFRSVSITPITYRLICTNGARAWSSDATKRLRHIGDPIRLRDAVREAIPLALAEARGDLKRWKSAVSTMIDDALDEVESLRGFGATSADVSGARRALADELGLASPSDEMLRRKASVFIVANAITASARDRSTEGRLFVEQLGHRYLVSRTR